ncbi:hypothetical protein CVN68_06720 [Sphingomonas psychrotolerans]|uniref:Uncharacterized protein n=1 Tax=Sphingomonas psychrotolerans TaxID=1327635 RepID=A0A2K8MCX2_9SPHN|nr:hypothetical protein CVN68_06720 [Sphingomonas psychrotolerans]
MVPSGYWFAAAAVCIAAPASAGPADWPDLTPIRLHAGVNKIVDIAGDGKPGTIRLDWRDNGNAWSYDIFTVKVKGSIATVDGKDRFTDSPHTGEDVIASVRFARGTHRGRTTTFALVSHREVAESVPDPAVTTITLYALERNTGGLGTPYIFTKVAKVTPERLYCHADMALKTELGFPLTKSYDGLPSIDGC